MPLLSALIKSVIPPTILPQVQAPKSIYEIEFTDIEGKQRLLEEFKGQHLLIVNTASKCGFTFQYEGLQNLYHKYHPKLEILGFPCNQFKKQEPGDASEIQEFCQLNYGVKFPMAQKVSVFGSNQHPVYKWLCNKSQNGVLDSTVDWNFQKYWIDPTGALRAVVYTRLKPESKKFLTLAEELINE